MNEKYYILYYPSSWGMGTNVDTRLVSDTDIRRLIRIELERKRRQEQKITEEDDNNIWLSYSRIDDRFTGTWNGEKFCGSDDIEEVVEDVIQKRLSTKSTYAPSKDLVLVPDDIPVIMTEKSFQNTIFRVHNQFGCVTDIIVGEGVFRRYILDLRYTDLLGDLAGGMCYDFLGYDMKNVLTTGLWDDRDTVIKVYEKRLRHFSKNGSDDGRKEKYLLDYLKDDMESEAYDEECKEIVEESKIILEKFRAVTPTEDKYDSHLLKGSSGNKYIDRTIKEYNREEKSKKRDHTLMAFVNPIVFPEFGQIWHKKNDKIEYFTYSELFKNGDSVEWLTASHINEFPSPEVVAQAYKEVIQDYLYDFKTIEFAVYCPPQSGSGNYHAFQRAFR